MKRIIILLCALIVSVSAMGREVVRIESWSTGEFYACYDDGTREQITKERFEADGVIVTK